MQTEGRQPITPDGFLLRGFDFFLVYFMDFKGIVPPQNVIFGHTIPLRDKQGRRKRINTNTHTVSLRLSVKLFTDGTEGSKYPNPLHVDYYFTNFRHFLFSLSSYFCLVFFSCFLIL